MFKKSLLAMTIAGASLSATAGILTFDVTETAATITAVGAEPAAVNGCALIADKYDATIDEATFTPDNATTNDVVTVTPAVGGDAGIYNTTANTVTYTGADACTVFIGSDILVPASDATYSAEGAAANGVTVDATLITGIGGVTAEDTIIVTVTGGVVDEDASAGASLTGGTTSTFTLLGVVGNQILFTVDTGAQDGREILDLADVVVTANDGATSISLSAATQNTANVQYDTSPAAELVVLEMQYTGSVSTKFDGIIDVGTERLTLAVNADDNFSGEVLNQDTTVIKVVENSVNGNLDSDEVVLTIKGDFSWMAQLDTSDDGEDITSAELATGISYSAWTDAALTVAGDDVLDTVALNSAMDTLTVTLDTTDGTDDVDAYHEFAFVVPGVAGETSLNEQTFTASVSSFDGTAEAVIAPAMTSLGEWTLNGSVVNVPYMPFGPNTQPILRHTNKGVQTGDISVRYMIEGVNTTWQSVGVVVEDAAPGMVNLLTPVMDAIEADSGLTKGKVTIEITTNVPGADVTVFAAAKITTSDSDRLTVGAF